MSASSDVEQFSWFWALAGRPDLFDPANELACLTEDATRAGVDRKMFLSGYALASELGTQSPPGQLLSRLAVYEQLRTRAEAHLQDPSLMPETVDRIDELYSATLAAVSSYAVRA